MSNNLDLIRGVYQAFSMGDISAVLGAMSADIRWIEAEGGPYGGIFSGPDEVLANVFMKLGTEWDGFAAVPEKFLADGATVVVLGEYSGTFKATGKSFRAPYAHAWTLRDGKVVIFQQYTDTALQLQATQS